MLANIMGMEAVGLIDDLVVSIRNHEVDSFGASWVMVLINIL